MGIDSIPSSIATSKPYKEVIINGGENFVLHVVAHEVEHNLGAHHAAGYYCTNQNSSPVSMSNNCIGLDRDPFDVMQNRGIAAHHTSAFHKARLGWLGTANLQEVTKDNINATGEYDIYPLEKKDGIVSLRVKIPNINYEAYYYIEYRDYTLSSYDSDAGGVFIRIGRDYKADPKQLGSIPGLELYDTGLINNNPQDTTFRGAALPKGSSFFDEEHCIEITNLGDSITGTGKNTKTKAKVKVEFGCGPEVDAGSPHAWLHYCSATSYPYDCPTFFDNYPTGTAHSATASNLGTNTYEYEWKVTKCLWTRYDGGTTDCLPTYYFNPIIATGTIKNAGDDLSIPIPGFGHNRGPDSEQTLLLSLKDSVTKKTVASSTVTERFKPSCQKPTAQYGSLGRDNAGNLVASMLITNLADDSTADGVPCTHSDGVNPITLYYEWQLHCANTVCNPQILNGGSRVINYDRPVPYSNVATIDLPNKYPSSSEFLLLRVWGYPGLPETLAGFPGPITP